MGKAVLHSAYNTSKVALQKTSLGAKIRIGLLILALTLPFLPFMSDYILHIVILIFLYMILALGLNIVPGFNGLLDLGYVGFYGIGAYTSGLLTYHFGLSWRLFCHCDLWLF